jgi:hypothetical protein
MIPKILRIAALAVAGAVAAWWGRLIAHSKTPPPEGHWREVAPDDLT